MFHAPCHVVSRADHDEETLASWLAQWILGLEISIFVIITRLMQTCLKIMSSTVLS